jgi:hypothetical protein
MIKVTCTALVETHARKGHKHGRFKWRTARKRRKTFVLKQMYFSVNNDNEIELKYIDLN